VPVRLLKVPFSVADAGRPTFAFDGDVLVIEFVDWAKQSVKVSFLDTMAFKWQEAESTAHGERSDSTFEILHSDWLAKHYRQAR
jgi:hypothetical protein